MLNQASARRAEKALQEILHKTDRNSNGKVSRSSIILQIIDVWFLLFWFKVKLKDYLEILDVNDIKVASPDEKIW